MLVCELQRVVSCESAVAYRTGLPLMPSLVSNRSLLPTAKCYPCSGRGGGIYVLRMLEFFLLLGEGFVYLLDGGAHAF